MESPNSPSPKNGERDEEQSQEHSHHFLRHQRIVYKEFVLAGKTVNSAYCDVSWRPGLSVKPI
jgi:hypothetical protein